MIYAPRAAPAVLWRDRQRGHLGFIRGQPDNYIPNKPALPGFSAAFSHQAD